MVYEGRTSGFCALCAIQKHVNRALQATGRSLEPKDFVSNLRCISRNFRNARQEDAHEYMVNLLESMHKCCLPSGVPSRSHSAYEKRLVHKIFGGHLRSQAGSRFEDSIRLGSILIDGQVGRFSDMLPAAQAAGLLSSFTAGRSDS